MTTTAPNPPATSEHTACTPEPHAILPRARKPQFQNEPKFPNKNAHFPKKSNLKRTQTGPGYRPKILKNLLEDMSYALSDFAHALGRPHCHILPGLRRPRPNVANRIQGSSVTASTAPFPTPSAPCEAPFPTPPAADPTPPPISAT